MNFIMLLLASITTVLFLVNLARGKQYGYMVESLDGGEYFLKELYVVGFSLNDGKIFKLRGKGAESEKAGKIALGRPVL